MEGNGTVDNLLGNRVHLCDSLPSWSCIQKPKPTLSFSFSAFCTEDLEIFNSLQGRREGKLFGNHELVGAQQVLLRNSGQAGQFVLRNDTKC